ncbi:hypothetical protein ABT224_19910 [Streptomyces sp. NPDC001584]|uniref:hypothetical protein n=1 Tax=Streptomyces sp. NPDC001584 TaxID=3154521 RepID=UPI00331789BC
MGVPAVDMLRAAIETAGRRGQAPLQFPAVVYVDKAPLAGALVAGEARTGKNRHPLLAPRTCPNRRDTPHYPSRAVERPLVMTEDELNQLMVQVPRPAVNGNQMACVSARFAREESPAIAHFAAAHRHVEEILRTVGLGDRRDWILGNIDRMRGELDVLEKAMKAKSLPLDLTERDSPTRLRTPFVGTPAGLRQPLDASKGRYDFSAVYRPAQPRKDISEAVGWLLAIAFALGVWLLVR